MLQAARDAALGERMGPKGTGGSKARGSMVRTVNPTKLKVTSTSLHPTCLSLQLPWILL